MLDHDIRLRFFFFFGILCLPIAGLSTTPPADTRSGIDNSSHAISKHKSLTRYPRFAGACVAFASGYHTEAEGAANTPKVDHYKGDCNGNSSPLVVSVTHENLQNNHNGARNYDPSIGSYMSDFNYDTAVGRWISAGAGSGIERTVELRLNTKDYDELNVTGWPLRYGHLFAGLEDTSVSATLSKTLVIEFDVRLSTVIHSEGLGSYSGRRVILGMVVKWKERPPRTNESHFFEIDLVQSDGYSDTYGSPTRDGCDDRDYDRCFYDPEGQYAEGREIRVSPVMYRGRLAERPAAWTHISVPIFNAISTLNWVSPPADWTAATVSGLYFAIESVGMTKTRVEIRNYNVYENYR